MKMKPGYKTTEFWLTVFAQVSGLVVLFGVLDSKQADTLVEAVTRLIEAVAGLLVAVAPLVTYIKERSNLKAWSEGQDQ